jgi:CHAT domain-containing protein/tetratricopeptide (TPR) repeat protein
VSKNPDDQAAMLQSAITQLSQEGRYDDALAIMNHMLDTARGTIGAQSFEYATLLAKVADLQRLKGDLPSAETTYRQTIEILKTNVGPDHPLLGEALNGLGVVLQSAKRLDEAEPCFAQGTEIFKNAFGEVSAYHAFALNYLAELYTLEGRYDRAVSTYERLLGIQRQLAGGPGSSYGERLTRLGGLYYELARYEDARRTFEELAILARKEYGENHLNYATSLSNLAMQEKMVGRWDEAEALYKRAIEIARLVSAEDSWLYASYIGNLANLYRDQGRYDEAVPLLRQAVMLVQEHVGKTDPRYATALNNLGVALYAMGQAERAEALFRQALAVDRQTYRDGTPQMVEDYMNLATVLMDLRRYEEAAEYLKNAEDAIAQFGPRHPDFARILRFRVEAFLQMRQFMQAEAYAVMAEEIWRTAVGMDDPNYADALVVMGWIARAKGQFADAENVAERALSILRGTAHEAERLANPLQILAGVYAATGRQELALETMRELAEVDDRYLSNVFAVGTERQRRSAAEEVLTHLHQFVSLALDDPSAVPAAADVVLRRKAIAAEALLVQREAVFGGRYPMVRQQLQELRALRVQVAERMVASPDPEGVEEYAQSLAELLERTESLEEALVNQIPEMNLERSLRTAERRGVVRALPTDSVLVEFARVNILDFDAVPARGGECWQPPRYVAFVLHADEPESVRMIDLREAEPIDELIVRYRAAITGRPEGAASTTASPTLPPGAPDSAARQAVVGEAARDLIELNESGGQAPDEPIGNIGERLRENLWDPLLPALRGCTRLFLALDGNLNRLPFETLPTENGRYVIDEYRLSYLSAGRDLLRIGTPRTGTAAPPLIVADPDFAAGSARDRPATTPFRRLEWTKVEAEKLAKLLQIEPLVGEQALEARVESALSAERSPLILHLATHGFFLPDQAASPNARPLMSGVGRGSGALGRLSERPLPNPLLRSGLALAGANTWLRGDEPPPEAHDGILFAEDVAVLDMLDTELVVLSACDTGLGEIQAGEGVFGLRRSFVLAGAKTLVMSLWKVPDRSTQELMVDLYKRILRGEERAEALRQAQLTLKARRPHPGDWGAFICQGDPGPLPAAARNWAADSHGNSGSDREAAADGTPQGAHH